MLASHQGPSSNTVSLTRGETLGSLVDKASYNHVPLAPELLDSPFLKGKCISSEGHYAKNSFAKNLCNCNAHVVLPEQKPLMNMLYSE